MAARAFADALTQWYRHNCRELPWRSTSDPYAIWVSEIMLQQTRVDVVIPYYERFLSKFPTVEALARAPEADVLGVWAGLGYYSRARNLQRAARRIVEAGKFPADYDAIRELPGIGAYTAAAVASIAFGEPRAVLDGNVMRVVARLTNDAGDIRSSTTRKRLQDEASRLIDGADPGVFNQAMMELGATLCTVSAPKCLLCPVHAWCEGREAGRQEHLPVKSVAGERKAKEVTVLIIEKGASILLWQRPPDSPRLAGFWELPEPSMLPGVDLLERIGEFRHSITNTNYRFTVRRAYILNKPRQFRWVVRKTLDTLLLSTTARKALAAVRS
jgi:A/G-specific adenine glycosylase